MKNAIFRLIILSLVLFVASTKNFSFSVDFGEKQEEPIQTSKKVYLTEYNESEIPANEKQQFISRFAKVAKVEMQKYGIPASIKLAQLIHESNWGKSTLFSKGNNGYGIKYHAGGKAFYGCNRKGKDCAKYQTYKTAWEGIRGHSLFLQKPRYKTLLNYGTDYKKWAIGLKKAGYATDLQYAEKLINIIESYKLHEYDKSAI